MGKKFSDWKTFLDAVSETTSEDVTVDGVKFLSLYDAEGRFVVTQNDLSSSTFLQSAGYLNVISNAKTDFRYFATKEFFVALRKVCGPSVEKVPSAEEYTALVLSKELPSSSKSSEAQAKVCATLRSKVSILTTKNEALEAKVREKKAVDPVVPAKPAAAEPVIVTDEEKMLKYAIHLAEAAKGTASSAAATATGAEHNLDP